MEIERETARKRKVERIKGKKQVEIYLWITRKRHWKTQPIYQAVGRKLEERVKEEPS